jgi:hypothetical protein
VTSDYAAEFAAVGKSLTHTSMELVCVLNAQGDTAAATCVAELADRVQDALKASAMVAEVYLR